MAFNDIEVSEYGSRPIELYTFSRGANVFRYNSSDRDVTLGGNVYLAAPIQRGRILSTADLGKNNLKIKMSRRVDFLNQFISSSPTDIIDVTVARLHDEDDESAVIWRGRVTNVSFLENHAEITCLPLFVSLRRTGLRRVYQTNCPHVLYGNGCGLISDTYRVVATLTVVEGNVITSPSFQVSNNPSYDADWFVGGYIEYLNNNVTDRRFITAHNNSAGSLTLNFAVSGLAVGSEINAYPGCNHSIETCAGKFSNVNNFGGFPYMPNKNPMDGTPVF